MENEGLANTDFYVSVSWNIKEFDKEKKVGLPEEMFEFDNIYVWNMNTTKYLSLN